MSDILTTAKGKSVERSKGGFKANLVFENLEIILIGIKKWFLMVLHSLALRLVHRGNDNL